MFKTRNIVLWCVMIIYIAFAVISCKEDEPEDKTIAVTDVNIDKSEIELTPGDDYILTAIVEPENATNREIRWSCSNESVVRVVKGENGKATLTAVGLGTANVAVTTEDGNISKFCVVTVVPKVYPVEGVTIEPIAVTIDEIGKTVQLIHTVIPENATNPIVEFTSDNENVATVDKNTGLVTAVASGTATITVTTSDGGYTAECIVTVDISIKSISLDIVEKELNEGEEFLLKVILEPLNAEYDEIVWESDDENVATVDENGKVTATGLGETTITVTVDGQFTATCTVTVKIILNIRKEFRGAWISTVWSIDWPPGGFSEALQKQRYIQYLDMYKEDNFNAIFMQVRGRADPFWDSQYESWSNLLAGGTYGNGNNPGWDVMQFLIEETHKRGMEFHAWINPFRITTGDNYSYRATPLDSKINPALVKDYPSIRVYNPALPEVHQLLADIVEELITKYPDIDGVHMDDYFYPDVGVSNLDDNDEYREYGSQFLVISNWRRDNVNKVIRNIQEVILRVNPRIVFSISPQGNESNNYNSLFADILTWCQQGWIDMVIPQIYQPIDPAFTNPPNRQDYTFSAFLNTWATKYAPIIPTVVGFPLYRVEVPETSGPHSGRIVIKVDEFNTMFELTRARPNIVGDVFFTTRDHIANRRSGGGTSGPGPGAADIIRNYYTYPAVRPEIGRKTEMNPIVPQDVNLTGSLLTWTAPPQGLTSVVYIIPEGKEAKDAHIVAITGENSITVTEKGIYLLSTFNRNNVESALSKPIFFE